MKHERDRAIQPYLMATVKELKTQVENQKGISHFYQGIFPKEQSMVEAVPDGCVDLVFHFTGQGVDASIGGTVLKHTPWEFSPDCECFGVRFAPGNDVLPKALTIDMLVGHDITIDADLFGAHLGEQLANAKTLTERSHLFLAAYEELLETEHGDEMKKRMEHYVRERILHTNGTIAIQELIEETGYSECYIRRIFKQYNGISPKQFAKFVRFQHLLRLLNEQGMSSNDLCENGNYYDEAHMMKEFKQYTGMTIEQYRKEVLPKLKGCA